MAIEDFDPDILNDFLTEGGELLDSLDNDLVTLEDTPDDAELLNRIFRALHTIKGSASFLAITNLVNFAHAAENALNVIRKGEVRVDQQIMDALLKSVDVLRVQMDQVGAGEEPEPGPVEIINCMNEIANSNIPPNVADQNQSQNITAASEDEQQTEIPSGNGNTQSILQSNQSDNPESVSCITERPLVLPDSKALLMEYMIIDLNECLEQLSEHIDELGDLDSREEAVGAIGTLTEELGRSLDFFELDGTHKLVKLFEAAADQIGQIKDEMINQVLLRLHAAIVVLREITDGLTRNVILDYPTDKLCSRLINLLQGNSIEEDGFLLPGASIDTALSVDGIRKSENDDILECEATTGNVGTLENEQSVCDYSERVSDKSVNVAHIDVANLRFATVMDNSTKSLSSGYTDSDTNTNTNTNTDVDADDKSAKIFAGNNAKIKKAEATIRVEVGRLETLQNLVGELVIQKNRITALTRQTGNIKNLDSTFREQLSLAANDLDRIAGDIQVGVMRTRMMPLDKLFGKYPRMVRDLARSSGKQITLEIIGGDTEVDKSVIEELADPLVHLLRNSADHGIEKPDVRKTVGKPEMGKITISAEHQGGHVLITIVDDGAGLNCKTIGAKALEKGILTEEELAGMSEKEIMNLVMKAGFSTAEVVSDLSGRGVGMDVVCNNIQTLGGHIDLDSQVGNGTTVSIIIPLTVAIMSAMMVSVGEEMYAIPLANIREIVKPSNNRIYTVHGHKVLQLRDHVLPLLSLQQVFNVDHNKLGDSNIEPFIVVVGVGDQRIGLMVTKLIGQQEIVIKPLDDSIDKSASISGVTIRDDGQVSLILDVVRLLEGASSNIRKSA